MRMHWLAFRRIHHYVHYELPATHPPLESYMTKPSELVLLAMSAVLKGTAFWGDRGGDP